MKRPKIFLPLAAALLLALVWLLWPRHTDEPVGAVAPNGPSLPASTVSQSKIENPNSKIPSTTPTEISHLADQLNASTGTIQSDLRIVLDCIENFRTNFPRDGNPVGSNAEITAALTGKNKLRYAVIPPNHPAINRDGELCDRWGTPFVFHAESGTRMTVRSAGPDKKVYTADDIELSP